MSAFGGKADMTACESLLSRSLLGAKRTSRCAAHMSAYDPKRTRLLDRHSPIADHKLASKSHWARWFLWRKHGSSGGLLPFSRRMWLATVGLWAQMRKVP